MGFVKKSIAVLALAGAGALAFDIGNVGLENYGREWEKRGQRIEERLDKRKAARRERRDSYEQALKVLNGTQPGDNSQIRGILDIAKKYGSDERMSMGSMAALWHIGTAEAEQTLRSLVVNPVEGETNLSFYAAGALGNISVTAARDVIVERGILERQRGGELPTNLKDTLHSIGDEASMEYFIDTGSADDLADFVIRNKDKGFFYMHRDRLIPPLERRMVRVYYGGVDGINCEVEHNTLYRFAFAINIVDRTFAEKYLLSVAESTSCTPFPVTDSLRNNSFK
ncbi:MAG: hypothetical protein J4400_00395 [Candidatus Aenigmarchaeota archaeon]|nr:hypothetical protein [Candidatus Aenigmarchaeota archaeon]